MRSRALRIALVALAATIAFALLWPSPIDAVAFHPAPARAAEGVLAPNTLLTRARLLPLPGHSVESPAIAADGTLYGATDAGEILRRPPNGEWSVVANTGGRPLGTTLAPDGDLLVADGERGLLRVSVADGRVTTLSTAAEGVPFRLTDDVAVARDGTVYFTDASDTWPVTDLVMDIIEARPHGRLLRYSPESAETTVLARGLYFANGVALADDESFLIFSETPRYRLLRYGLRGEKEGKLEPFLEHLPGFPDNVRRSPRGTFWLALYAPRKPLLDLLHPYPWAKEMFAKLPPSLLPRPARTGHVLEVAADGRVLRSLQDPTGETVYVVTSAVEHDGALYLGSFIMPALGVLDLGALPAP